MKLVKLIFVLLVLLNEIIAFAQSNCYNQSQITITSSILKEKIKIGIFVPESYDKKLKLKSVYVLDGDYLAPVVAANLESISEQNQKSPCIIIAVTSSNRQRDFTPISDVASGQMAGSGGADNYLKYLESELIPMIENKYNTNTNRIIIGHSLGGLLAYYSIIKNPTLFPTIISIDGRLWWNEGRIGKTVIEKLKNTRNFRGEIFECRKDISQPVQFQTQSRAIKISSF